MTFDLSLALSQLARRIGPALIHHVQLLWPPHCSHFRVKWHQREMSLGCFLFSPDQRLHLWHGSAVSHVCSSAARSFRKAQRCPWRDEKHRVSFHGIQSAFEFNFCLWKQVFTEHIFSGKPEFFVKGSWEK